MASQELKNEATVQYADLKDEVHSDRVVLRVRIESDTDDSDHFEKALASHK